MPYTYQIDVKSDTVSIKAEGKITDQELVSLALQIVSQSHYHRGIRFVADYTGVIQNDLSPKGFQQAAIILKYPSQEV
ncbi:MAG: hypothetical protein EXS37_13635 [Opitutus sp.]|nr:hypothetical protein [Opitutus sp.]